MAIGVKIWQKKTEAVHGDLPIFMISHRDWPS